MQILITRFSVSVTNFLSEACFAGLDLQHLSHPRTSAQWLALRHPLLTAPRRGKQAHQHGAGRSKTVWHILASH